MSYTYTAPSAYDDMRYERSFVLFRLIRIKESLRRGPPRERHAHHSVAQNRWAYVALGLASCLVSYAFTLLRFPLFIFFCLFLCFNFVCALVFVFVITQFLLFNCVYSITPVAPLTEVRVRNFFLLWRFLKRYAWNREANTQVFLFFIFISDNSLESYLERPTRFPSILLSRNK